ncbi:radical SAM protein [Acidobacteria bacterium AH-259-D05]|nr:radical SAM protein [Acidobacteria bacterium AH-259-D05]
MYQKDHSFVEIRQKRPDRDSVYVRVRRLHRTLENSHVSHDQSQMVKRACEDILEGKSSHGEPCFHLQDYVIQEIIRLRDNDLPRYLFYRYRYEMFPRQRILDEFPPCLHIEPTSICNYTCVFCFQTDKELTDPQNGHMGMMDLDLCKRIIDQAQGKCEAITLVSRGEPLMNRQIEDMLAYASGKFLGLKINTNASFLDERKCHAILRAGVNTLVFSADAAAEPLYSQLRVGGKLDRVVANIRLFQEIRSRHYPDSKTITRVSGVKFCADQNLDDMEGLWGDLVDEVAFVKYQPWENTYQRPINEIGTPCSDLWRRMFVCFDGTVNPCDVDYKSTLAVGNATQESLSDIWRGEKYSALRAAHGSGCRDTVSPCNRCTFV